MNTMLAAPAPAQILIVDDTPDNLRVLMEMLTARGYRVRPAPDGEFALNFVRTHRPDLVLLDIMMPGIDGYEVCRQLKANPATAAIPVIFLSALEDAEHKVSGFEAGGVDYITKPFHVEEVLARVQTHLTIQRLQHQLQEELQRRQVVEQSLRDSNASKDKFFSILAHDLRTPFTSLLGLSEILIEDFERYDGTQIKLKLKHLYTASKKVYDLLNTLLEWSRLERGLLTPDPKDIPLATLVRSTVQLLTINAVQKQITLKNLVTEELTAYADPKMIQTVIRNLLSNAVKFTPPGGTVTISAGQAAQQVEIMVTDTGIGINPKDMATLFRIDAKTCQPGTAGETGTGLGLILCKELVELNGGTIRAESELGKGSRFIVIMPRQ
jgi:two-component system, sensor histidine kinase and response regulator